MKGVTLINKNISYVIFIFLLSFFYVLPLLVSNSLFADDLWRVLSGYPGFLENGRFMAEGLMYVISSGYGVLDPSPITQILAAFIYWYSGYIISKKVSPEKSEIWNVIIGSSFLIGPFTIPQISFKFDSLTMALSVFSASLSYVIYRGGIKNSVACISLIIISLGFYQPSMFLAVCFPFAFNVVANKNIEFKKTLKDSLTFVFLVLVAFVLYKKALIPLMPSGSYAQEHSQMVGFTYESINIIKGSVKSISYVFYDLLSASDGYIFYIILALPALVLISDFIRKRLNAKSIIIKFVSYFVVPVSLYFPMALLKNPILEPRVMSSACLLLFIFFSLASKIKIYHANKIITLSVMAHFYIMMSIYSNALTASYNNNVNFSNNLSVILLNSGWKQGDEIYFSGQLQNTMPVLRFFNRFPFYKRVIQNYYTDSYILGYTISRLNGLDLKSPGNYYIPDVGNEWVGVGKSAYGNLYERNGMFLFKFNR
ncbi:glucosyltransferase domain-containing protein [Citrobacter youngae]|uniref:glucosyltransferase domain-containing protein n=1 Tax=Citrobacter youngae TaxID=133448 RepID=UPI00397ADB22